jgi:hypothetical protein
MTFLHRRNRIVLSFAYIEKDVSRLSNVAYHKPSRKRISTNLQGQNKSKPNLCFLPVDNSKDILLYILC